MSELRTSNPGFLADMREIVLSSRNNAVRSVEYVRKMMYWHLGERIFVEEQRGQDRAEYGEYIIRDISKELEIEFGSGFTYTQLTRARFVYPTGTVDLMIIVACGLHSSTSPITDSTVRVSK